MVTAVGSQVVKNVRLVAAEILSQLRCKLSAHLQTVSGPDCEVNAATLAIL
jgi:hypothetical protein